MSDLGYLFLFFFTFRCCSFAAPLFWCGIVGGAQLYRFESFLAFSCLPFHSFLAPSRARSHVVPSRRPRRRPFFFVYLFNFVFLFLDSLSCDDASTRIVQNSANCTLALENSREFVEICWAVDACICCVVMKLLELKIITRYSFDFWLSLNVSDEKTTREIILYLMDVKETK